MKYRRLNLDSDYPILAGFWESSKMKVAPPKEMLTLNGIVAERDSGEIIGAIFQFFIIDSNTVILGYPIVNPKHNEYRSEIIDKMYEVAEQTASYNGYTIAQTFSNLDFVKSRLEKNGWATGDLNMDNYLKRI